MTQYFRLITASSLALALATPAAADLTAQQVWENWKALGTQMGQTLTVGSETFSNGTLTLIDVGLAMDTPDGGITANVPLITMQESEGEVLITMSPQYDMRIQTISSFDEATDMTLQLSAPGLLTTASGSIEAMRYDMAGPELKISLTEMMSDGAPADIALSIAATDLMGNYVFTSGTPFTFDSLFNMATLTMDIDANDLDEDGSGVTLKTAYENLRIENAGSGKGLFDMADPVAMFSTNSTMRSTYAHGGSTFALDVRENDENLFNLTGTSADGALEARSTGGSVGYEAQSNGLDIKLISAAIPFPELTATMDTFGFGFTIPMMATQTPEDFAVLLNLSGLEVSDMLWGMIDPTAALPRDPATLLINLTGKAKMLIDLANPDPIEMAEDPSEIHALTLKELRLSIAGAELTGAGDFTFDNSDTTTFDGLPAPDGAIDLQLVGGNGLLAKLVQMGLVPQDQAMGAQMMMGLFATPTGEDTMSSKIEITPDGAISANGQRLQ